MSTPEELLAGYMAHAEAVTHQREDHHFWAFEEMRDLLERDPETTWTLAVRMIALASDDATLGYVAAGPLEDLICKYPYVVVDRVETLARQDARFRKALAGVWGWSRIPKDVRARLDKLVSTVPPW